MSNVAANLIIDEPCGVLETLLAYRIMARDALNLVEKTLA